MAANATTVTILFTDLVNSTELMQRAGDEDAQSIVEAHYQLLRDAVDANGGAEVKSLGDGLMVAFNSAADAVRCATMMQQTSRRPVNGERLAIKVGLNAGDALRSELDYFGTAVVTARRLCDRAGPGQILCSALVEGLLAGRQAFSFRDLGDFELKGITAPVATREVIYDAGQPGLLLTRTPFVGREGEMSRINAKLAEARSGRGSLVLLVGEPGIGKSRMIEEFVEHARGDGVAVLCGASFEGEWVPPYAPFAEAIAGYVGDADPDALRKDLGYGGPPLARLVPALREALPDLPEPAPLQPDEERFRLLDAVSQFLIATSERMPVVLVLDDLQWADKGTIAMLRHVAHFVTKHRILLLGAYRDVELDRQHPLSDALAALRREVEYERIALKGLNEGDVGALLTSITELDAPAAFVHAISEETDGNPFFIREVLLHLTDEGKIYRRDSRWTTNVSIADMGIPEGVRQVIGRRLLRVSDDANKLLATAAAFSGSFRIDIAATAAGLDESAALDAIDAALKAQLVRSSGSVDTYEFTHAIIRHTLYAEMSPSRQVRLHRQIAEAMERVYGERAHDHAAELAYQFHRSAGIPGFDRGAPYALAAAEATEATGAWDDAAQLVEMALELMPSGDARRPRTLGRLAFAQGWALRYEDAERNAREAASEIASAECDHAAAEFVADAVFALRGAGDDRGAWNLTPFGLDYLGSTRDATWARLMGMELLRRMSEDPSSPGIPIDCPEISEISAIASALPAEERAGMLAMFLPLRSREDCLAKLTGEPARDADRLLNCAGEFSRAAVLYEQAALESERAGKIGSAVYCLGNLSRCHIAQGDFADAQSSYDRGAVLSARLTAPGVNAGQLLTALLEMRLAKEPDHPDALPTIEGLLRQPATEYQFAFVLIRSAAAFAYATYGRKEEALRWLSTLVDPIERAPSWATNYPAVVCLAAWSLWLLNLRDHTDLIERNLRRKVVEPDFRYPMQDGRLSLARICALTGRYAEARDWFAEAREVLEGERARPLLAICDYDEALMYARRSAAGDRDLALELAEAAVRQFSDIGMTGWLSRGEELRRWGSP